MDLFGPYRHIITYDCSTPPGCSQFPCRINETILAELLGRTNLAREWRHACSAIFELRDLAVGIEHRISQGIGRALAEAERHEDHTVCDFAVGAQDGLDAAASRLDLDHVADRQAPAFDLVRVHGRNSLRLDRV